MASDHSNYDAPVALFRNDNLATQLYSEYWGDCALQSFTKSAIVTGTTVVMLFHWKYLCIHTQNNRRNLAAPQETSAVTVRHELKRIHYKGAAVAWRIRCNTKVARSSPTLGTVVSKLWQFPLPHFASVFRMGPQKLPTFFVQVGIANILKYIAYLIKLS